MENGNAAVTDGNTVEAYGADIDAICRITDMANVLVVVGEHDTGPASRGSCMVHA